MQNNGLGSKLVYSTTQGAIRPECAQAVNSCVCRQMKKSIVADTDGLVRLRYETNGRRGKGMTLICGLALNEFGLLDLAKQLKQRFGTGGAVKDFTIQLQGDFRDQAKQELLRLGYQVK